MKEERSTKYVTMTITATFHGDYLGVDEVTGYLQDWISRGLEDRDDLRSWDYGTADVAEVEGDPEGFDSDDQPDWVCVNAYPEHDYNEFECKRCGAEPDA